MLRRCYETFSGNSLVRLFQLVWNASPRDNALNFETYSKTYRLGLKGTCARNDSLSAILKDGSKKSGLGYK